MLPPVSAEEVASNAAKDTRMWSMPVSLITTVGPLLGAAGTSATTALTILL